MSEDKLTAAKARGEKAEALLKDELLSESFKELETSYIRHWSSTEAAETVARENYWRAVQILGDVRKHLAMVATNGRIAAKELDQLGGLNRLR